MVLSIAIVGFDRMAQRFYAVLQRLAPDARYSIADPSENARKALSIFPEAACFTAVEKLADLPLDAALITSSPATPFHAWRIFGSTRCSSLH